MDHTAILHGDALHAIYSRLCLRDALNVANVSHEWCSSARSFLRAATCLHLQPRIELAASARLSFSFTSFVHSFTEVRPTESTVAQVLNAHGPALQVLSLGKGVAVPARLPGSTKLSPTELSWTCPAMVDSWPLPWLSLVRVRTLRLQQIPGESEWMPLVLAANCPLLELLLVDCVLANGDDRRLMIPCTLGGQVEQGMACGEAPCAIDIVGFSCLLQGCRAARTHAAQRTRTCHIRPPLTPCSRICMPTCACPHPLHDDSSPTHLHAAGCPALSHVRWLGYHGAGNILEPLVRSATQPQLVVHMCWWLRDASHAVAVLKHLSAFVDESGRFEAQRTLCLLLVGPNQAAIEGLEEQLSRLVQKADFRLHAHACVVERRRSVQY